MPDTKKPPAPRAPSTNDSLLRVVHEDDLPAYVQTRLQLKQQILNGTWREGTRLPSQLKLAEMLGVSRITVVRAIQELVREGFLDSQQGVGTFVARRQPPQVLSRVSLLYKQEFGSDLVVLHEVDHFAHGVRDARTDDLFPADTELWYVRRFRALQGRRVSYEETFFVSDRVPASVSPHLLENTVVYDFVTKHCRIPLRMTQVFISASAMTAHQAEVLGGKEGDTRLAIKRIYLDMENRPVSLSFNMMAPEVQSYYLEFRHPSPNAIDE